MYKKKKFINEVSRTRNIDILLTTPQRIANMIEQNRHKI